MESVKIIATCSKCAVRQKVGTGLLDGWHRCLECGAKTPIGPMTVIDGTVYTNSHSVPLSEISSISVGRKWLTVGIVVGMQLVVFISVMLLIYSVPPYSGVICIIGIFISSIGGQFLPCSSRLVVTCGDERIFLLSGKPRDKIKHWQKMLVSVIEEHRNSDSDSDG